jgi:hypothetical protein
MVNAGNEETRTAAYLCVLFPVMSARAVGMQTFDLPCDQTRVKAFLNCILEGHALWLIRKSH